MEVLKLVSVIYLDWFYHIPAARPKNSSAVVVPIQSQIPGLSNIPEDSITKENEQRFKRKWIRDTDSKYVKLAKAGGRKSKSDSYKI